MALDVVRITAACIVAFGHLSQRWFSSTGRDFTFAAQCAVAVFFLLSGFVIRYVTCQRPATFRHYLGDRASRIYSVAIPALFFTLLVDLLLFRFHPAACAADGCTYAHMVAAIGANLIFCGQLWNHHLLPVANSPFWSVNYEVAYYLLYGCWFYLRGMKRWCWLLGIALFFGPRVLYLAPLWILGCLLHDLYQQWHAPLPTTARSTWRACLGLALFGALFALVCLYARTGHDVRASRLLRMMFSSAIPPADYLFGLLWTVPFALLLLAARRINTSSTSPTVRTVRFVSEGTFPIYLLHIPLFLLIAAFLPYNHAALLPRLMMLVSALVLGVLAGHPGNLLKDALRTTLSPTMPQSRTAH